MTTSLKEVGVLYPIEEGVFGIKGFSGDKANFSFDEIRMLLIRNGYSDKAVISTKLIEIYLCQNKNLEREIQQLSDKKLMNDESNKLIYMLKMTPVAENTNKVLKYERSLQKSIFQNC